MFGNVNGGYSLADIAAATTPKNEDGFFGGNSAWWIILLFMFAGGWGGGGFFGGDAGTARDAISYGFDMNNLENGIRGIQNGLADGFYEMNNTLMTGFGNTAMGAMQNTNTIMGRLSDMAANQAACCCETQRLLERGLCEVNYNVLTQSNNINTNIASAARDIIDSNNAGVRSILDFLTQDKIATLQAENQSLRLTASQQAQNAYLVDQLAAKAPVPAYVVANPNAVFSGYGAYGTYYGNCGCNA